MTPKMMAALSAAEAADHVGGLAYTKAGWIDPRRKTTLEYHNFTSVNALSDRGYLWEYGKAANRMRSITEAGRQRLEQFRQEADN